MWFVFDTLPYGTSMPRVGAVHHIKIRLARLFNHQIGQFLNVRGHVEAESPSSLKIYNQFEFHGGLNREIAWFFAFQNAIDVSRRGTRQADDIWRRAR